MGRYDLAYKPTDKLDTAGSPDATNDFGLIVTADGPAVVAVGAALTTASAHVTPAMTSGLSTGFTAGSAATAFFAEVANIRTRVGEIEARLQTHRIVT